MTRTDPLAALAAHPGLPDAGAQALIDNGLRLEVLSTNPHLRAEARDRLWGHTGDGARIDFYALTVNTAGDPARLRRAFAVARRSGSQRWASILAGLVDVGGHDDDLWGELADTIADSADPARRRLLTQRLMASDAPPAIRRRCVAELTTESQLRFLIDHHGDPDGDTAVAAWPSAFGSLGARTVWAYGLLRAARPDLADRAATHLTSRPVRRGDLFALVALTDGGPWHGLDVDTGPWHDSELPWPLLLADPHLDAELADTISERHHITDPWDRTRDLDDVDLDVAAELVTSGPGWLTSTRLAHRDDLDELLAGRPLDPERRDMWDTARRAATGQRVGVAPADRVEPVRSGDTIDTSPVDALVAALGDDQARWRLALTLIDSVDVNDLAAVVDLAFDDTPAG